MRQLRIGLAQINTTVGDFDGNTRKILDYITEARSQGVDLVAFPEMAICGYPPEDLLLRPEFINENLDALERIIEKSSGITVVVGFVHSTESEIYNSAAVIHDGNQVGLYHKYHLPNYGVFDEERYFTPGRDSSIFFVNGVGVGVNVCEDIWYEAGPATVQAYCGAEVILNISASPYHYEKRIIRERMLSARAADYMAVIAYNNLVGGQDELVFDGNSIAVDQKGQVIARGKPFEEDLLVFDLDVEAVFRTRLHDARWRKGTFLLSEPQQISDRIMISEKPFIEDKPEIPVRQFPEVNLTGEIYDALVLGTRDYVLQNDFTKVVIGVSGGIDSSLVASIAVDALGKDNVVGVTMPSRYSSPSGIADVEMLAKNLGIRLMNISIETVFEAFLKTMSDAFSGTEPGVAEENIQARIRGSILMALSNKFGWLPLATGNKSEIATGYTTLYGDMVGGFAVISDVPKTMVFELARYRNAHSKKELIPETIIEKPPSAELNLEQKDTDVLPPYDWLDPVLKAYVEEDMSIEQITAMGFERESVEWAANLVDHTEYKRRQAPIGLKITPRAFGRDRRLPITNRFKAE